MNYGMRCHDICPKSDMDMVFDAVQNLGVRQIQLAPGKSIEGLDFNYGHYSPGLGRMMAQKLQERDIHVAILGCYINPTNPNETKRQTEVQRFIEHLKYARVIGADMVGTETGRFDAGFRVVPETRSEECYRLLLKSMKEIVTAAEKLGMIVGVEGVHDHTLYDPQMMRRFLEDIDSPNVEVILDPVNLISLDKIDSQAEVIDEAFQLYGDRITMVHVKDFVREGDDLNFAHVGEGLFNYLPLMKHLKEEKPFITMLLENSSPEHYHKDVEYLQKIYEDA